MTQSVASACVTSRIVHSSGLLRASKVGIAIVVDRPGWPSGASLRRYFILRIVVCYYYSSSNRACAIISARREKRRLMMKLINSRQLESCGPALCSAASSTLLAIDHGRGSARILAEYPGISGR